MFVIQQALVMVKQFSLYLYTMLGWTSSMHIKAMVLYEKEKNPECDLIKLFKA